MSRPMLASAGVHVGTEQESVTCLLGFGEARESNLKGSISKGDADTVGSTTHSVMG